MNKKALTVICLVAVIVAGSFAVAQQPAPKPTAAATATTDKLDKIIQQNEQLLQQQADILKELGIVKTQVAALHRRST